MNNVARSSLKAASSALGYLSSLGKKAARGLTFVPAYLQNLLWILSQAFLDLARGGYGGNSAVYAVLRTLSMAVAEPPLIAGFQGKDGEDPTPLPRDHPLAKLIMHPNDFMTQYEMWELITLHLGITGRATWWKERNNLGEIIGLWPLRPDRVGPVYSNDTSAGKQVISGWSYLIPGTSEYVWVPRQDIFFLNLPDPAGDSGGMVEGLGPLQVLAAEVGADNEATRFVGAMLANYGTPGMVIHTKASLSTQAQVDQIKAAARQEFGGMKRGSPGVLDADTSITPLGFNLQQLEFPALRDVAESRVAAAYGVPAVLVGLHVGMKTGQAYASLQAQREYFAETTCENYWRRIEEGYGRDVAADFGEQIVTTYDRRKVKALQVHQQTEIDKIADGFKQGAVTLDEYRTKVLGLPVLTNGAGTIRILPRGGVQIDEHGDVVGEPPMLAPGVVPVDNAGISTQPPDDGTPPREQMPVPVSSNGHAKHPAGAAA